MIGLCQEGKSFPDALAVLADSLAANPLIHAPEQYVRSVRHQFEKQGMETEKAESFLEVSGLPFVQAILKVSEGGSSHYRAIYTTFLNGYILSLDVSAATREDSSGRDQSSQIQDQEQIIT